MADLEPKIIAFIGAGCVGKSTLFEAYRSKFVGNERVSFAFEAAKQYFSSHNIPDKNRFTAPVQGRIQAIAMSAEQDACRRGRLVFADRSVLDYPIYVSAIGDSRGAAELMGRAQSWVHMYRQLYLLDPTGIQFEQTGERREDAAMRLQLHREFLSFLAIHDIPYTLLTGTVEDRMATVDIELQGLLLNY